MIKNERQYRITKAQANKFEKALQEILIRNAASSSISILDKAQEDALHHQLTELRVQLSEYEALKSGNITTFHAENFEELPYALIKARIATGMSQKDFANHLGVKEQQVQKYEATGYASASYERLLNITRVLGVEVKEEISLTRRIIE